MWDGFWVLDQELTLPKKLGADKNIDAIWYGVTLYDLPLSPVQVNAEFQ